MVLLLAAAPVGLAVWLRARRPGMTRLAVVLLAVATAALRVTAAGLQAAPLGLEPTDPIVLTVTDIDANGYFTDAQTLVRACRRGTATVGQFLDEFPSLMPHLRVHSRIRAPGEKRSGLPSTVMSGGVALTAMMAGRTSLGASRMRPCACASVLMQAKAAAAQSFQRCMV